jgi:hypothetical protein
VPLNVRRSESSRNAHARRAQKGFHLDLPDTPAELTSVHLQFKFQSRRFRCHASKRRPLAPSFPIVVAKSSRVRPTHGSIAMYIGVRHLRQTKNGPALIEEATTTTLVLPGQSFEMYANGQLIIREAT